MSNVLKFYGDRLVANFSLISSERFCVEVSGFNQQVIDVFRSIKSKSYDPHTRIWNFLLEDYDSLFYKMQSLKSFVTLKHIPAYVIKCMKTKCCDAEIDFNRLDPVLVSSLLPFQMEGLKFGINKNGKCFIADDMGLGKTFQALAIANYYQSDWPLLIATSASMKTQWEQTISNYLPSVSILEIQYMISGKDYIGDSKILIVSYDLMARCINKLEERNFGVLIMDESHLIKNPKSKSYLAAEKLSKKARRVILLSGTPALSRPNELYTQLSLLDRDFFGNFYTFTERYCDGKQTRFGWDASGSSNLQELELVLSKKFMIRRTKSQVLESLPDKKQEIVTLDPKLNELSQEDRNCILALEKQYLNEKGSAKHAALLTFFSETAKIKVNAVCSYIIPLLEKKEKMLIFAHHQVMLNALENIAKRRNVKYIRIDGKTTTDQRNFFINKFQVDDNCICAILSILAANAGITLTSAKRVIFAELHWNPTIISQAEARAHRIGQENEVLVQFLLAKNTADDSIWPMLQEKQKTLKSLGLNHESFEKIEKITTPQTQTQSPTNTKSLTDIREYFTPQKKRKVNDEDEENKEEDLDDIFNDGFDDILNESSKKIEEDVFNDGFNDLFCDIDF